MAAAYCYEGIPLRFLASLFDIQMRYLVYMRYLCYRLTTNAEGQLNEKSRVLCRSIGIMGNTNCYTKEIKI